MPGPPGRSGFLDSLEGTTSLNSSLIMVFLVVVQVLALPSAIDAQVHYLQEIPWHVLGQESRRGGVELSWMQHREPRTRWHADRLGLAFYIPAGEQGFLFLREDYVRFDTAGLSIFERWPHIRSADLDEPAPDDRDWPHESVINDFARPEIGLVVPLRLPLLEASHLGLRAGLPIGTDRLYPMSAGCLPISVDWRVERIFRGAWQAVARLGMERTFASSADELDGSAFPGGRRYGFEIGHHPDRSRGVNLAWSARELDGGRHSRQLALCGRLPLGQGHHVRFLAIRDLSDRTHRLSTWTLGLTWHLAPLPSGDEQNESPAGQNADRRAVTQKP